jgi:SPP1 gp7 family putative phage head morphogenesis protein
MSRRLPFNLPFKAAAKHFAKKVPLTREQFDLLAAWAKTRAFTVATVTKARVLEDLHDGLQKALEQGLTFGDFNELLDDVMGARGWAGVKPWHAENVFRTNLQSAYGAGRWKQQQAQRDDFPFLQLHEVDDDRTRDSHHAVDGTVKPVGDRWWLTHYPPWAFMCRGSVESLTEDEARAIGISPVNMFEPGPADDDFTSPAASDLYEPNYSKIDPRVRSKVRSAIEAFDPDDVDD